jgi:periplasmic copper chaperone A
MNVQACRTLPLTSTHSQILRKYTMKISLQTTLLACLLTATQWASAQAVEVTGAWARATVQGQKASGAFMQLTAPQGARLVAVASPVAGVAEVHEMKMEGDVMKMRALPNGLELPAGKAVTLSPGGFHVMLMDLKVALQKDTTIPMTLVFKDSKGVETKKELRVPVSVTAPAGAAPAGMAMPMPAAGGHVHGK